MEMNWMKILTISIILALASPVFAKEIKEKKKLEKQF
jgi:hypothetical protein